MGSLHGSSLAAILCGNRLQRAVAVDDFSEFGGSREALEAAIAPYVAAAFAGARSTTGTSSGRSGLELVTSRFQAPGLFHGVSHGGVQPFHLYLYDGPHGAKDHFDGVTLAADQGALADPCVCACFDAEVFAHVRKIVAL